MNFGVADTGKRSGGCAPDRKGEKDPFLAPEIPSGMQVSDFS